MKQFFDECYQMKAFKNPIVVELIGICLDSPDGFPLMILPLFPDGNLKTYLQRSTGFSSTVTVLPEVSFLLNNSDGNIVHLVSNDWKCKYMESGG